MLIEKAVFDRPKIVLVIGTRPEAIKVAPVVHRLEKEGWAQVVVVSTGQHDSLLHDTLTALGLTPDHDLALMRPGQQLSDFAARCLQGLGELFRSLKPAVVIAQGDTTTTFVSSLAAFYHQVPFAHLEAGLRTGDVADPFPEEAHRRLVSVLAKWHFCPTEQAKQKLLAEGVDPLTVHVTGNTVIDALHLPVHSTSVMSERVDRSKKIILLTAHRRESFGAPLRRIFAAVKMLCEEHAGIQVVFPVHPNPCVRQAMQEAGLKHERLIEMKPQDYVSFVALLKASYLVLSDSGGIQEEACYLGKPILVLRETTERAEAIGEGPLKLIGTNVEEIFFQTSKLLRDSQAYMAMAKPTDVFGDGAAAQRIASVLRHALVADAMTTA